MSLSEESLITRMELTSTHSIHVIPQLPLEVTMQNQMQLSSSMTGVHAPLTPSNSGERPLMPKNEKSSVMALPNLRSNVKPHELLEKQPEPRVLRVSKEDITALTQVIKEFQEQLEYYK
jgi:hypothetical protein